MQEMTPAAARCIGQDALHTDDMVVHGKDTPCPENFGMSAGRDVYRTNVRSKWYPHGFWNESERVYSLLDSTSVGVQS